MDHFFQLPLIGPPSSRCSTRTRCSARSRPARSPARLGTLVTGVTYRNPALLAKAVTALDVISNGRALLGIGAAWYELEHERSASVPAADRALRAARGRAADLPGDVHAEPEHGRRAPTTRSTDAWNSPAPVTPGGPPILVGGTGERKTFRLAAQYADELNINAAFVELPRKLAALDGHLPTRPRPRTESRCRASRRSSPARRTTRPRRSSRRCCAPAASTTRRDRRTIPPCATVLPRLFFGDPDEVVAQVRDLLAVGLDGVVVNMLGDGHDLDGRPPRRRHPHPRLRQLTLRLGPHAARSAPIARSRRGVTQPRRCDLDDGPAAALAAGCGGAASPWRRATPLCQLVAVVLEDQLGLRVGEIGAGKLLSVRLIEYWRVGSANPAATRSCAVRTSQLLPVRPRSRCCNEVPQHGGSRSSGTQQELPRASGADRLRTVAPQRRFDRDLEDRWSTTPARSIAVRNGGRDRDRSLRAMSAGKRSRAR